MPFVGDYAEGVQIIRERILDQTSRLLWHRRFEGRQTTFAVLNIIKMVVDEARRMDLVPSFIEEDFDIVPRYLHEQQMIDILFTPKTPLGLEVADDIDKARDRLDLLCLEDWDPS